MNKVGKVKVSNALIDACYRPESLYQMRLMLAAIAQIKDGQKITHNTEFEISAQGIADLVGIAGKSGSHYQHLKAATDQLRKMTIRVDEYHDGRKRRKGYQHINITSRCAYLEDEAAVVIQFGPHILPYISQLCDRYKPYLLKTAMKMKSGYGIRLYELCLRWAFVVQKEFEVDEFRQLMGLDNAYSDVRNLKNRVIMPAIADVNEHTEFTVTYGQRKTGRTITHIQFGIREKKKTSKKVTTAIRTGSAGGQQDNPPKPHRPTPRPANKPTSQAHKPFKPDNEQITVNPDDWREKIVHGS